MRFRKFRVEIGSKSNFKRLVADIYYENQFVAMLTQENGDDSLQIEIFPPQDPNQEYWIFNFAEFDEAIHYGRTRLLELRKLPED